MRTDTSKKILHLDGPAGHRVEIKNVTHEKSPSEWTVLGVSEIGFTIALPIVAGAFFGLWIDERFAIAPRATLSGIAIGIFLAFSNLFWWVKRYTKKHKKK